MKELSPEMQRQIREEAKSYDKFGSALSAFGGYVTGAAKYALLFEDAERRNKEWSELFAPLLEYGQSKEANIPLEASITAVILERAKVCEQMAKAMEEIDRIHQKYHDLDGNNPAANHLRNIAYEALVKYQQTPKP
jgi:hypothetical protein